MNWYLLPLDRVGNMRGPRYLKWRGNPSGLDVRWSLMDFGALDVAVVAADTNAEQHATLTAYSDCFAIADEGIDEAIAMLDGYGIDTSTLVDAPRVEQQHRILALAQVYQSLQAQETPTAGMTMAMQARHAAPVDVAALARAWAGQPIHFGIVGIVVDDAASD